MNNGPSTILVVDDNENNRDMLARRLQRQGYYVVTAEDGLKALHFLHGNTCDLVLLDVMMPELNGYQVLEQIKATQSLRYIPVIMISALDDLDSVVRCIELGAEDYLFKPFNPTLLRARVSACLEKKRLHDQEQEYLRAIKQDLELGRRTQSDFLPAELPRIPGWNLEVAFTPAREVAGDFYDVFPLPHNHHAFVVADICDKGVGAALFMVLTRSLIRAFAEQVGPTTLDALKAVLLANDYIARHHHRNLLRMYATLFFGVLNPATSTLTYINAGHPAPILMGAHGVRSTLEATGPAVGMMPGSNFIIEQAYIAPGEILLAYTDGITEARNRAGQLFGEDRLIALLNEPYYTIQPALSQIESAVHMHTGDVPQADDITILALQRIVGEGEGGDDGRG